jgi:hypothetical protein
MLRKVIYMTMETTIIRLRDFGSSLQGRIQGGQDFANICGRMAGAHPDQIVVLDFHSVRYVTGSWLNAMVVPLFGWAAHPGRDLFPVLKGVRDEWFDELYLIANWNQQCYLIGDNGEMPPKRAQLVGHMEQTQLRTLDAVLTEKQVTGAELARKTREGIGATAWNNRLKDLYVKRLVGRTKNGRKQYYYPIIEEITTNGR